MISSGELKACLAVAADEDRSGDLPDPAGWEDLTSQPDRVAATVRARFRAGRTPAEVEVFPWPKDRKGWRGLAWVDPFDQVAYRAMVGRHVEPIKASVDGDVVLSARVRVRPPGWRLLPYQKAVEERRERAMELLAHGVFATIDIEDYFPSVTCAALETVFGPLPLHRPSFDLLLGWLAALHRSSPVTGLPIGPGGSDFLGNALLVPGDELLAALGVTFLRYVDDTWLFLHHPTQFPTILDRYAEVVSRIGLRCHPVKSTVPNPLMATEHIQRSAIQYAEATFADPGKDDLETALELFDYAMEAPDARSPELRKALVKLKDARATEPFTALTGDLSLVALAPRSWRSYLRALLSNRKLVKKTGVRDWLIEQAAAPVTTSDGNAAAVLLQAASPVLRPSKAEGTRLLDAAQRAGRWAEPVSRGATHLWGRSQAFKPNVAVEAAEAAPTLGSKRGYAMALGARRGDSKMPVWVDGLRRSHADLEATAAWLEAA